MPKVVITQKNRLSFFNIPHYILINGRLLGIMKDKSVTLCVPPATFEIRIQSMFRWFFSSAVVSTHKGAITHIDFSNREKWWDILFVIDIILWCVKRFLNLAAPWTWIYEIFTNGYLVAWIIYEWSIRKRYFRIDIYEKPDDNSDPLNDLL